jgi:hypothetical protein
MNNLQTLSDKLHEYNQTHSTAWAILLCTPRTDEVFIVDEENNGKSPSWWPCNDTGETIKKALELVPKEPTYTVTIKKNAEDSHGKSWTRYNMARDDAERMLRIMSSRWCL